jgi:hypothetical protein
MSPDEAAETTGLTEGITENATLVEAVPADVKEEKWVSSGQERAQKEAQEQGTSQNRVVVTNVLTDNIPENGARVMAAPAVVKELEKGAVAETKLASSVVPDEE